MRRRSDKISSSTRCQLPLFGVALLRSRICFWTQRIIRTTFRLEELVKIGTRRPMRSCGAARQLREKGYFFLARQDGPRRVSDSTKVPTTEGGLCSTGAHRGTSSILFAGGLQWRLCFRRRGQCCISVGRGQGSDGGGSVANSRGWLWAWFGINLRGGRITLRAPAGCPNRGADFRLPARLREPWRDAALIARRDGRECWPGDPYAGAAAVRVPSSRKMFWRIRKTCAFAVTPTRSLLGRLGTAETSRRALESACALFSREWVIASKRIALRSRATARANTFARIDRWRGRVSSLTFPE